MSNRVCLVDGRAVGAKAKAALCAKCGGAWSSYRRHLEKSGREPMGLKAWAAQRRGEDAGEAAIPPPTRKTKPQPAAPVGDAASIEARLIDIFLAQTDWAAIPAARKRAAVAALLEM